MAFWNFRARAQNVAKQNEILKQIRHVEASLDEQLPCKRQYNATTTTVNGFMHTKKCNCSIPTINGLLQCQSSCTCDQFRKTCDLECACEGMCIPNTFLHMPEVNVRLGIAGDELYAEEDIEFGRLAYIFTGKMTSLSQHSKIVRGKQPDLYTIIARWQGEDADLPGKAGDPTFVVDSYQELAGFVNHSCNPNTEVYEIWQNGKLYVVGKTIKYCFKGDNLSFDYNWTYTDGAKYAELCFCGAKNCRAFIAKAASDLMQKSIIHYKGILKELEAHNVKESYRLENLTMALRINQPLTLQEKIDAERFKKDIEELRLTKRKAILMKKGILMAKAKVANFYQMEKYQDFHKSNLAQMQPLPDFDEHSDSLQTSFILKTSEQSESLPSSSTEMIKVGPSSSFGADHVLETRITQAMHNEGLHISVKVPLAVKDNDICVLMGVQDIDKMLEASKISAEGGLMKFIKGSVSLFWRPFCSNASCSQQSSSAPTSLTASMRSTQSKFKLNMGENDYESRYYCATDEDSGHEDLEFQTALKKNKYKMTALYKIPDHAQLAQTETSNPSTQLDKVPNSSLLIKKKESGVTSGPYPGDVIKDIELWGEGLFTVDEIKRILSWIDGTLHARGISSHSQPWRKVKEWAYWLHKSCRQPTPQELQDHMKTWVGISTRTLRAADSEKIVHSRTIPLARDVNTLLGDVLTFIPYRFSGFKLVESKKAGNIWRIVWSKSNTLPGNPLFCVAS